MAQWIFEASLLKVFGWGTVLFAGICPAVLAIAVYEPAFFTATDFGKLLLIACALSVPAIALIASGIDWLLGVPVKRDVPLEIAQTTVLSSLLSVAPMYMAVLAKIISPNLKTRDGFGLYVVFVSLVVIAEYSLLAGKFGARVTEWAMLKTLRHVRRRRQARSRKLRQPTQ